MLQIDLVLLADLFPWLIPVWLVSSGAAVGLAILILLWFALAVIRRSAAQAALAILRENLPLVALVITLCLTAFAIFGTFHVPVERFLQSLQRVWETGTQRAEATVAPKAVDQPIAIQFRGNELKAYTIESSQDISVATAPLDDPQRQVLTIQGGLQASWMRKSSVQRPLQYDATVDSLYLTNDTELEAQVLVEVLTDVEHSEVYCIPIAALSVVGFFLFYLLLHALFPKVATIAVATSKQAVAQPIFYIVLSVGVASLLLFVYIPYNTFGEDVKMLKDSGLTLIMVLSILLALWTASVSIADEIDGKTALTLLSKPISRRQFILGKFFGIVWPIAILFIVLGLIFLMTVSYKVVYDAREAAKSTPGWELCYAEMIHAVPGLTLAFLEAVVLTAISVAISTRLSMLPNLVICGTIYVLGHLVPLIVDSSAAAFQIVRFFGLLLATLFPVLDHFNVQAAVAAGKEVPAHYLAWAFVYCVLYCTIMLLLALALFEDRDLA